MRSRCISFAVLVWLVVVLLGTAGCGRTTSFGDPCANGQCSCIFDADCPDGFVCIDSVCIDRDDFVACLANGIAPETCNGRDDDCDGRIDEGLPSRSCDRSADGLSCPGIEVCAGAAGYVCDAPVPGPEICDGVDNDCNGVADDPFVDAVGLYTSEQHCGGCDVDCDALLPGATDTACEVGPQGAACRVVSCPPGSFANDDRTACLGLPDALCRPCESNEDCLGPDSRCLTFDEGERACGRDCAPGSPYGTTCPDGYDCVAGQCRPVSETCQCTSESVGATRSCLVLTCDGFETCEPSGDGFEWGSCDISAWREACDGLDNDCDGAVDNGFLNPVSGRYESDEHCGQCNNDCGRRWVAEVDHAVGGCDLSRTVPDCQIVSCTTEQIAGMTFEWVDVNALPDDGCECRRREGNVGIDDPDRGSFTTLLEGVVDENCDGIDGVIGDALFVSAEANPGGDGSLARPFQRIQDAVDALLGSGRVYVLVAEGVYRERVVVSDGVQIYGGYSEDFQRRDVLRLASIVQSPIVPGQGSPGSLVANGVGASGTPTIIAGLHVYGADAPAAATGQPGATSVAVWIHNAGPALRLQNNVIRGGRGGTGGRGADGATGFGRQQSTVVDGADGLDGQRIDGACPTGTVISPGAPGTNPMCSGVNGRTGGAATCPAFDWTVTPVRGTQAIFQVPTAGGDGAGGFHRSFDDLSGASCSHVTESGFPSDFQTHNGADGLDGSDGASGDSGAGCAAAFGSFITGEWTAGRAGMGSDGVAGAHGAGGGAGGGTARFTEGVDFCNAHEVGATGGGGGAGGCPGFGGRDGGSGGASIAVLVSNDAPSPSVVLTDNRIERGPGGRGGDGGFGGPGGQGGRGGFGGRPGSWSGSTGGKGGEGGNGGAGGGGGGGCGGPSFGVLSYRAVVMIGTNDFTVPDDSLTGGLPGDGGTGAPAGRGARGGARNALMIEDCSASGECPDGFVCDGNQVCVPD